MNRAYSYSRNNPIPFEISPTHFFALAGAVTAVVRKNQKNVGPDFPQTFRSAIEVLTAQGNYSRIVGIHANMDHRMHSMNGPVGTRRFLPWHRIYLIKMEAELRVIDPSLYIPYWDWVNDREVPEWLQDFLPQGVTDLNGTPLIVTRYPGTDPDTPDLPTEADLDNAQSKSTYLQFTRALESVHNTVHMWTGGFGENGGGTMTDIMYSPADPVFWLHHAFIDHEWAKWQQTNPGQMPQLAGADRVLDPWAETIDDAMSISSLGYAYE
jgi:tyrosinase